LIKLQFSASSALDLLPAHHQHSQLSDINNLINIAPFFTIAPAWIFTPSRNLKLVFIYFRDRQQPLHKNIQLEYYLQIRNSPLEKLKIPRARTAAAVPAFHFKKQNIYI